MKRSALDHGVAEMSQAWLTAVLVYEGRQPVDSALVFEQQVRRMQHSDSRTGEHTRYLTHSVFVLKQTEQLHRTSVHGFGEIVIQRGQICASASPDIP